jgi:hypothetical protein
MKYVFRMSILWTTGCVYLCRLAKETLAPNPLETNHVPICVDNQTRSVSHRSEDVVIDHVADLRRKRQEREYCVGGLGDFHEGREIVRV